ncbi:MAG TPA: hypothetical protein VHX88_20495 [Solirubrobacteraceae bacterium]|jgi:hypothetical protein|nr:hypothetical protein [Solirubrobacteraceae bacterium]
MPAPATAPGPPPAPARPPARDGLGLALIVAAAVLLFVSLFLHWYQPGRSAWTMFETWDLVLAVLSVTALVGVAARLGYGPPLGDRWLIGPSAASLLIVAVNLANPPPAAIPGTTPMVGAWLALGATLLMGLGTLVTLSRISVAITLVRSSPRGEEATTETRARGLGEAPTA